LYTGVIFEEKLQREGLDTSLKRFGKHEAPTKGIRAADQSTCVLKRMWPLWMNW